jgi:hypothetical protein
MTNDIFIGLAAMPAGVHPHPGGQLGRDIQHRLAVGGQSLRQRPARARDARWPTRRRAGLAQGRRGPCAVWRSFDVGPLERAEPGQDALPDASFQAVDQYLVAKLPGQAQIPR